MFQTINEYAYSKPSYISWDQINGCDEVLLYLYWNQVLGKVESTV